MEKNTIDGKIFVTDVKVEINTKILERRVKLHEPFYIFTFHDGVHHVYDRCDMETLLDFSGYRTADDFIESHMHSGVISRSCKVDSPTVLDVVKWDKYEEYAIAKYQLQHACDFKDAANKITIMKNYYNENKKEVKEYGK